MLEILFLLIHFLNCFVQDGSFFGDSFIYSPQDTADFTTDIKIQFVTSESNGIILLALDRRDYLIVFVQGGDIYVKFNLGSGEEQISTLYRPQNDEYINEPEKANKSPESSNYQLTDSSIPNNYSDLQWHSIFIYRINDTLSLVVDGVSFGEVVAPGNSIQLNLKYGGFIGGLGADPLDTLDKFKNGVPEAIRGYTNSKSFLASFRGCLANIVFNGEDILSQANEFIYQLKRINSK